MNFGGMHMPLQVSSLCGNITPSATLRLNALAAEKRRLGQDIISLAAGEPDFPTPLPIKQAGKEAIDSGKTVYTPTAGIPDIRRAIAQKYRDIGIDYQDNQVIAGTGAKQVLMEALLALVEPGDEVLLPTPCWLSYPEMIRMAGGVPIPVHTNMQQGYIPTREQLETALTSKTRAIIINNPNNPTGMVWDKATLSMIANLAKQYDFAIISDEIYESLCYDGCQSSVIAGLSPDAFDRTITISGFSKAYAMTGWRLGYALGPQAVIAAMDAYQSHATGNTSSITQYAGLAALLGDQNAVQMMREAFKQRRNVIVSLLNEVPDIHFVKPTGAFYVLIDIHDLLTKKFRGEKIGSDLRFSELLMEHALISVVPGTPFYAPGCIRLSYAIDEARLREAARRLCSFITELV